jgi:uncharacterized protein with PQ loop repeat
MFKDFCNLSNKFYQIKETKMSTTYQNLSHSILKNKKQKTKLTINPNHVLFSKWYDRYMILIAILGSVFVYLQAATIIQNESSENVSMPSYVVFLIVSLSWMIYGVLWMDWIVIITGLIAAIGGVLALISTISYRPSSNPGPFTTFM